MCSFGRWCFETSFSRRFRKAQRTLARLNRAGPRSLLVARFRSHTHLGCWGSGGGWWLATVIPWSQASGDVCSACSAYSPKLDHTYLTASQSDYATTKHRLVRNLPKNASVMSSRPPSHSWWKSLSPKLSGQVQWDHICRLIAKSRVWDEALYLAPHSIYAPQSDVTVLLLIERLSSSNRIALWNARSKPSLELWHLQTTIQMICMYNFGNTSFMHIIIRV